MKKEYVEKINAAAKEIFDTANQRYENRIMQINFTFYKGEQDIEITVFPDTVEDIADIYNMPVKKTRDGKWEDREITIGGVTYRESESISGRSLFEEGVTYDQIIKAKSKENIGDENHE